ncbi:MULTISPECIES: hypothetical protein [unclassified Moorena]|nr:MULTISPECIES: hypothetical protein [unclassified Moorena]
MTLAFRPRYANGHATRSPLARLRRSASLIAKFFKDVQQELAG